MDGKTLDDDLRTTWMRPEGIKAGEWVSNSEAVVLTPEESAAASSAEEESGAETSGAEAADTEE